MNFCPCQYFQCIEKTFLDSAIFARSSETPSDPLNITMRATFETSVCTSLPMGNGKMKEPSSCLHFAKRQKTIWFGPTYYWILQCPIQTNAEYLGETQISIGSTSMSRTLRTRRCLPIVETLRGYGTTMADKVLRIYNQDLSGFFISIDSDRFIQRWYMLVRFLEPSMSVNENEFFSVSPVKQNNLGDIIKGRTFRTLNVNRHIRIGAEFSTGIESVHSGARISNGLTSFSSFMFDGGFRL